MDNTGRGGDDVRVLMALMGRDSPRAIDGQTSREARNSGGGANSTKRGLM